MAIPPCSDPMPARLNLDPGFRPCEAADGDEIYPNGIFEFNITRLEAHIRAAGQFRPELVALVDVPYAGTSPGLNELTILRADLSRPVILAEIAPGRYNLIDGHHRFAKARRDGVPRIPAYRIPCPEHLTFLTSIRAYEKYIEYWNLKVEDAAGVSPRRRRTRGSTAQ
jgi:hypothetical protein